MTRLDVFCALLALPDDLGMHRGHVRTQAGDPRRRERVLLPLLTRWAAYRYLDRDLAEEPVIVGTRREKLKLVKRA